MDSRAVNRARRSAQVPLGILDTKIGALGCVSRTVVQGSGPVERGPVLRTDRLLLRRWRDEDLLPFAALNADADVMACFPALLTKEQSDALAASIEAHFDDVGFGLWAVEVCGRLPFIGFVGLNRVPFTAHFTPAVEIGWRLARPQWGNGYATEAARAALNLGFAEFGLSEIVSFTAR